MLTLVSTWMGDQVAAAMAVAAFQKWLQGCGCRYNRDCLTCICSHTINLQPPVSAAAAAALWLQISLAEKGFNNENQVGAHKI